MHGPCTPASCSSRCCGAHGTHRPLRTIAAFRYLPSTARPFFVYGAAFFYERTPRDRWRADLEAYRGARHQHDRSLRHLELARAARRRARFRRAHERAARSACALFAHSRTRLQGDRAAGSGDSQRMAQRRLSRLAAAPSANTICRYTTSSRGVIRRRRRCKTRTPNAAGDEWLHNATHLNYASAWLHDVLHAIEPWSHDVIAIALDDDQGAYIDNDTWPAPHWHAYIGLVEIARSSRLPALARAALHQYVPDEGYRVVAGMGVGQLVSERRVPHRRSRSLATGVLDRVAANAVRTCR